jgi:hypothetical protein
VHLIDLQILERRGLPRRPGDDHFVDDVGLAQAEGQGELDGRQIALRREELAPASLIAIAIAVDAGIRAVPAYDGLELVEDGLEVQITLNPLLIMYYQYKYYLENCTRVVSRGAPLDFR